MASTYLTRTNSSPTNAKKYTWSSWNKIDSNAWMPFFSTTHQGGHSYIGFSASADGFGVIEHGDSAGTLYYVATSASQRDVNGWYHVVVQFDSTQSTASDRVKLYINNELQTNLDQNTYPSQNLDSWFVDATTIELGRRSAGSGQYYSGIISHAHFIDGTVYAPSTFGEYDANGVWKIKTSPSVTYGNNGFWMFKDNNSLNDNSGNGNNFTLGGGTLTKTEDNPSNVFATLNPLDNPYTGQIATFSNGNTTGQSTETGFLSGASTIGVSNGKYYAEIKPTNGNVSLSGIGVMTDPISSLGSTPIHDSGKLYGIRGNGTKITGSSTTSSWSGSYTTNDILGLALDLDNNRLYISKNGQYADGSGNFNQAFTGSPAYVTLASNQTYFFVGGSLSTGSGVYLTIQANFGNGYFGTTAVASAGTNASGNGIFEYDVPTGYTALSTKGLNL